MRSVTRNKEARRFSGTSDQRSLLLSATMRDYRRYVPIAERDRPAATVLAQSVPDRCHLTYCETEASGTAELCLIADGFLVVVRDDICGVPDTFLVAAPDILRVRIATDGDGEYVMANGDILDIRGAGAAIIIEPNGAPPAQAALAGRQRAVHVYIHRDALDALYTGETQCLPTEVRRFLDGTLEHTVARRLPLSSELLRLLEDLQNSSLSGRNRQLFFHGSAVKILCHALDGLARDEDSDWSGASAVTTRGVLRAKQVLADNYIEPPSLYALARDVGLSRTVLCAGFRQIVGESVFDHIATLRMDHALKLLARGDKSVTEVAHSVGYSHLSSFSIAVQRRYGATPSQIRRQGLAGG